MRGSEKNQEDGVVKGVEKDSETGHTLIMGLKESIQKYTPEAEQLKLMLANAVVHFSIGVIASVVQELGTQSVMGVLKFVALRNESYLKTALNGRSIALISAGTFSITLLYKLNEALVERISSLQEQDFYKKIIKCEQVLASVTLYNDNNKDKIVFAEVAKAYAELNKYWYDSFFGLFTANLLGVLCFTYFTTWSIFKTMGEITGPTNMALLISFVLSIPIKLLKNGVIYIVAPSLEDGVKKENEAKAELIYFLNRLAESDIKKMGVYGLVPELVSKLFAVARSSSSLSNPHKIYMGLLYAIESFIDENIKIILLLIAGYKGIDQFIKTLTGVLLVDPHLHEFKVPDTQVFMIKISNLHGALAKYNPLESSASRYVVSLKGAIVLPCRKLLATMNYPIFFKRGEIIVVKGSSACGKSTLIDIITGNSSRLSILPDKKEYIALSDDVKAGKVQIVPSKEYEGLPHTTLLQFITGETEPQVTEERRAELIQILKDLELDDIFYNHLDEQMPITISNGQGKRLLVARGMYNKVKLMALDETFSAVSDDPSQTAFDGDKEARTSARSRFMDLIKTYAKKEGAAIICISHESYDKKFLEFADSLVLFKKCINTDIYNIKQYSVAQLKEGAKGR